MSFLYKRCNGLVMTSVDFFEIIWTSERFKKNEDEKDFIQRNFIICTLK